MMNNFMHQYIIYPGEAQPNFMWHYSSGVIEWLRTLCHFVFIIMEREKVIITIIHVNIK